jgi:hypothetical protein
VRVVAIVPAKDRADSVATTVSALRGLDAVDRVLVVDDGSRDDTATQARAAGADVLRLPVNRGKGAAVAAGIAAAPETEVFLLIDADLAGTAAVADALLAPVLDDRADLAIGVLPAAGSKAGFGTVRTMAARGIRRACGLEVRAPLSGQRAVRAELVRDLRDAERFGLEVAMTIDVARAGARVVEVDVAMDHRHTGRSLAGFAHRGRQGLDIGRALWPRLTTHRQRVGLLLAVTVLLAGLAVTAGSRALPVTEALPPGADRVLVFGMTPYGFDDLGRGATPTLDRLAEEGALAAMSVRTVSRRPSVGEGYLSLGAGARMAGPATVGVIEEAATPIGPGSAAELVELLTGTPPRGELVAVGGPAAVARNLGPEAASAPGALGDALAAAGLTAAAIGNSDQPATFSTESVISRPTGLAVMGSDLSVPRGVVDPDRLLLADPGAPFGVRADADAVVEATLGELERSDVVVVDPGDLTRADRFSRLALGPARTAQRNAALSRTDDVLARVLEGIDDRTLVLVVSVAPPGGAFRLTPLVAWGPGVAPGHATSPSTQRQGLVTVTDLAPTILDALGVDVPATLPGNAIRYQPGDVDVSALRDLDRDTLVRERTYYPQAVWFIALHAVVYALALVVVSRRARFPGSGPLLRWAVLALASYPVATFAARAVPTGGSVLWPAVVAMAVAGALAALATRARGHPLSPLGVVLGATVLVIVLDTWTGTRLQVSSWLGYSLHSAGRFYGIPNTTFAVLAASALVLVGIIVDRSARRREALWAAGCLLALVALSSGAPMLGANVGSLITMVVVFGGTMVVLSGRQIRWRTVLVAGLVLAAALGAAAGIDLTRPPEARSHLGQFVEEVIDDGPGTVLDTFTRKQAANLRIMRVSIWTWMIPVAAIFVLYLLVWERRATELLPPRSPLRTTAIAVAAGALVGFVANDSGPIVIALFFAVLPPVLTLLALHTRVEPPELLSAGGDETDPDPTPEPAASHEPARAAPW